jgi:putative nucleotidyltransferase with HDIG domain
MTQAKEKIRLDNIGERTRDLPTLPIVATNILEHTNNPKSSALQISRIIRQDPALASRVLRMANSAFYGFPGKISTISRAVIILGFDALRNIVLASSVFEMFPARKTGTDFDPEGFWMHSIGCAVTSKVIGKKMGMQNLEEVFLCGLLHDIGKLVLHKYYEKGFSGVLHLIKEKEILMRDGEQELLGVDHAEVGGKLAEKWNLPKIIVAAIRFHHNPPLAHGSEAIAAIAHSSDILCRAIRIGNAGDRKIPCINKDAWKLLGLNKKVIRGLFSEIEKEVARAKTLLACAS